MGNRYDLNSVIKQALRQASGVSILGVVTAALAGTAIGQEAPPLASRTDEAQGTLQEVIVTAEKRKEPLQSVPISVSVITPQLLQSERIQTVADIASYVPSVYVVAQPGGNSIPQYTIRGVEAGNAEPQVDNPVTLYLDGVPIGREVGSLFDLGDIERIEVLRGPQGTLFGRDSTGGAISVTTTDPTGAFGVKQDFTGGNYSQFLSRTIVNTGTWKGFSAQLTYVHNQRNGDVRNLGAGTQWNFANRSGGTYGIVTAADTLGGANTDAFRIAIAWHPFDAFSLTYKYDWTDSLQYPPATVPLTDPDHLIALGGGSPGTTSRPDAFNNWFTSPNHMRVEGHNLTAEYTATSWLKLKDIFGYRDYWNHSINQLDGAGGLHDPFGLFGGPPGSPLLLVAIASQNHFQQVSDELQANFTFRPVDITSGLMYFKENLSEANFNSAQTIVVSDAPNFVLPGSPVPADHQPHVSKAVYSQATFHLVPTLDLIVGGRETHDNRTDIEPLFNVDSSYTANEFNYLAGLDYKPARDVMLYAKYSTGYVPGGRIGPYTFKAETLRQAEVGVKSELFHRTVRINADSYYSWYYNRQFPTFINGVADVRNAARAHISGFELETTAIPFEGLQVSADIGYTNYVYQLVDPSVLLAVTGSATGTLYPSYTPKWTGTASVQYAFARMASGGQFSARVDTEYRSWFYTAPTGIFPSPSTWLLNGRLALEDLHFGSVGAEVALWGKNLTNKKELTYITDVGVTQAANYEAARTFGVDVSFRF